MHFSLDQYFARFIIYTRKKHIFCEFQVLFRSINRTKKSKGCKKLYKKKWLNLTVLTSPEVLFCCKKLSFKTAELANSQYRKKTILKKPTRNVRLRSYLVVTLEA